MDCSAQALNRVVGGKGLSPAFQGFGHSHSKVCSVKEGYAAATLAYRSVNVYLEASGRPATCTLLPPSMPSDQRGSSRSVQPT
ncbi:hypothetical protein Axi01nite_15040 [Actinoplanes xinjiangensis]|nr:hypothetical protein Axi01nite_15040 [Actinoplanes xinjiangensis]